MASSEHYNAVLLSSVVSLQGRERVLDNYRVREYQEQHADLELFTKKQKKKVSEKVLLYMTEYDRKGTYKFKLF